MLSVSPIQFLKHHFAIVYNTEPAIQSTGVTWHFLDDLKTADRHATTTQAGGLTAISPSGIFKALSQMMILKSYGVPFALIQNGTETLSTLLKRIGGEDTSQEATDEIITLRQKLQIDG